MRIVIDANIFISALITRYGTPAKVINEIVNNEKHTLLLSSSILDEIKRVLTYPKIKKYIPFSDESLNIWLTSLEITAHDVCPRFKYAPIVLEDPKDDIYIITAIEGRADCIVSGDKHLLNLHPFQGINILKPVTFLKQNPTEHNEELIKMKQS